MVIHAASKPFLSHRAVLIATLQRLDRSLPARMHQMRAVPKLVGLRQGTRHGIQINI